MAGTNEYHWIFGNRCHIKFPNGGAPVADSASAIGTEEGCAAFSDSAGNLLFYTDGSLIWNSSHAQVASGLGGNFSSANSSVIVPPAGGGSKFHIFTTGTSSGGFPIPASPPSPTLFPIRHTEVTVAGPTVSAGSPQNVIDPAYGANWRASESLAATPHRDCRKYWVIGIDPVNNEWVAILVDGDGAPNPSNIVRSPYGAPTGASFVYGMQISADGNMLAHACFYHSISNLPKSGLPPVAASAIHIFDFDRATGAVTYHSGIGPFSRKGSAPYGLEFTDGNTHLYFTDYRLKELRRHQIAASNTFTADTACSLIYAAGDTLGALQTGPDGLIYGSVRTPTAFSFFSISTPNAPLNNSTNTSSNQTDVGFRANALDASGLPLNGNIGNTGRTYLGLPRFTRIADDCLDGRCETLAAEVNSELEEAAGAKINHMVPCEADKDWEPQKPACRKAKIPEFRPHIAIKWGDSECDCIESDDKEIMTITVCNPYSNVTLSGLTIQRLRIIDAAGNPPAVLPNGDNSIELVPVGPYCFDDIAECSCVSREFALWTRGAISGEYHIEIEGVCFDVCLHQNVDACYKFNICKD